MSMLVLQSSLDVRRRLTVASRLTIYFHSLMITCDNFIYPLRYVWGIIYEPSIHYMCCIINVFAITLCNICLARCQPQVYKCIKKYMIQRDDITNLFVER